MSAQGVMFMFVCVALFVNGTFQNTKPTDGSSESGTFRGADQYDFSIVLSGGGQECFWHYADKAGYFYFNYEVQWMMGLQNNRAVTATVNAPTGHLIDTSREASGQINFKTNESGFYQICLNNFLSHFGSKQIFISFGVYYDGFDEKIEAENKEKVQLNDTLAAIQGTTIKVQSNVFHMWRFYNFARMRKGADYFIVLASNNYVNCWSFAQSVVIVSSGILQLYFLKRLFAVRVTTASENLRC
ncbi:transmembrane emp24 domain-containing protein 6 [Stegostoma tigrinum]|uniref:transmembrane emp24 domain-containing protein 6 n=1 Tax=Stegostoma tigrinum TaxID=3053191 RepID=UPI00202ACD4D|nr:transmembrane emp24 domain-containing protein 6 [Stegostoma tigrinum]